MARATSRWPTANGGARRWHLTASFFSSITAVSTTPVRPGRHWVQRTASNGITGSRTTAAAGPKAPDREEKEDAYPGSDGGAAARRLRLEIGKGGRERHGDRKSVVEGKGVAVRVYLGVRRISKNKYTMLLRIDRTQQ